jgi:signal transduction histidine kinase
MHSTLATTGSQRFVRPIWVLWGEVVLLAGLTLSLELWRPAWFSPGPFDLLFFSVLPLLYASVGALILARHPRHRVGLVCLGFSMLLSVAAFSQIVALALVTQRTAAAWWKLLSTITIGAAIIPPFILLALWFPSGRLPSPHWRWVERVTAVSLLAQAGSVLLTPVFWLDDPRPTLDNPIYLGSKQRLVTMQEWSDRLTFLALTVQGLMLAVAASALVVRWRRGTSQERQQIQWLLIPVIAGTSLLLISGFLRFWLDDTWFVLMVGIVLIMTGAPLAIGVAMVRHHLFDIDLLISRTALYATLTLFIVTAYALIVGGVGALMQGRAHLLVALLATGLIAVAFNPLRDAVQRRVNRWMYGQRDEPYSVVAQLGQQFDTAAAPDALAQAIVTTLAHTLKLPYVAIALLDHEQRIEHADSHPPAQITSLPLHYHGEPLGMLHVGGAQLSAQHRALLHNVVRQISIALHAARASGLVQHSRERIVAAREEERRRLRRDLHDGLGPTLASLYQRIDAASHLLEREPAQARELLNETKGRMKTVIGDIRQLVYALRPPALDELGLVGAIHSEAERLLPGALRFELLAPQPMPPLPAASEVAAYWIAVEAIANVVKHAQATVCRVRIELDHALHLTVSDDGVGFQSMRERVDELGGTLAIAAAPPTGTSVSATLPLPSF